MAGARRRLGGSTRVTLLRRLDHVADRRAQHRRGAPLLRGRAGPPRPLERGDRLAARAPHLPRRRQRLRAAGRAPRSGLGARAPGSTSTGRACTTSASASTTCGGRGGAERRRAADARLGPRPRLRLRHDRATSHGVRIECTQFVRDEDVDRVAGLAPRRAADAASRRDSGPCRRRRRPGSSARRSRSPTR